MSTQAETKHYPHKESRNNGGLPRNGSLPHRAPPNFGSGGKSGASSKKWLWVSVALVVVAAAALGGTFLWFNWFGKDLHYSGPTDTVKKQILQLRITERGELESSGNSVILCRVKGKKGSVIKIRWVIPNGTQVYEGQKLIELDASPLEEDLKDQKIILEKSKAEYDSAVAEYKITEAQNDIDEKKAKVEYDIAVEELNKYENGDYIVEKNDLKKLYEDALSDVQLWQKRYSWSLSMLDRGYYTEMQVAAELAKKNSAEILLENLTQKKRILETYARKKMMIELKGKKEQAEKALAVAKLQSKSKIYKAKSARGTQESLYLQEKKRHAEILEEITNCTIRAPRDGLVIYHVSQQSRWGRGSSQNIIAEGEQVSYEQKLMQIPDLTQMQVQATVHEAMVKYLRKADPNRPEQWQRATIRVSAYPSKTFSGHVTTVGAVASQADFLSTDVRVYKTIIKIDDDLNDKILKPGMSATCTIVAYETPKPVLTIPIQAVVGSITMGKNRKCFVVNEDGIAELRDIEIGLSNERIVEVKRGLSEQERVALDPESLLPPDSPLRAGKAQETNRRKRGFYGGKGRGKDKGRNDKGGGTRRGKGGEKNGNSGGIRGDRSSERQPQVAPGLERQKTATGKSKNKAAHAGD